MTRNATLTAFGLLATLAASSLSPALADGQRDRRQTDKNNARNVAIAGAAVAVYGLLNHNSAATVLGAAGAALGGSQYEKDRKQQSQDNNGRGYYRSDRNGSSDRNRQNDDRNWNNSDRSRDTGGWSQGRGQAWDTRNGSTNGRQWNGDNNSRQWTDSDYHRQGSHDNQQWNRDGQRNNTNRDSDRDVETCNDGGRHTHDR